MKSKKLKYCLSLSKTRISVDLIKFTLSSEISEIKMEKGNQKLTFRIRRISCSQRENHNHSWQSWCPKLQNVLNLKKEDGEMEAIRKLMDYLDPVLVFKKTSVTIEESEFVEPFFSWNKVKKFEELTISKEPSRDPTTGEPLAINVTLQIYHKILDFRVLNLKLCIHVVDHPGIQYQYQSSRRAMTINFMRMPLLVQEVVSKHIKWNGFDFTKLVVELLKSRKLRYCIALSKTHISVDSIKFKLASKNSEIKMQKGSKKLTIRVSSLPVPSTLWLYQSRMFSMHQIRYMKSQQPWWPEPPEVINVKKEEREMETIRRVMDYLNPFLIFKNTSVKIEESEFVDEFFSWNKTQKFEELTISKGFSRDQTMGEPLAINVTSRILLQILEKFEAQSLKLCLQVIDAPNFQYQFSPDKNYKFKRINIEWTGWLDVDSLLTLNTQSIYCDNNVYQQNALIYLKS
ncbi:hypothetical protein CAEBREN_20895 [Caenorhabditis brenneri]|uniref:Uncharacterized protein n=1 Tax=Caenorhabditis brenneri TaxID=135651 RepID=G0MIY3_CAEBE|nr:hypothetical protein CAEBREN_20895 [Caenorhabditis brenneri]